MAKSESEKRRHRLGRNVGRAVGDFALIEPGDRIMVCLSGGKDSYSLLILLQDLQQRLPIAFELVAVHLDQMQPGYDGRPLEDWLSQTNVPFEILREDTYSIVKDKTPEGKAFCSMCSRLRRGILYTTADRLGCSKIALGHHADDAIETLLLNQFFAGSIAAMPPKLIARDGRVPVIRPLIYCHEAEIAAFAEEQAFPILPCNLCGSQDGLRRQRIKALLAELEREIPHVRQSMLASLAHIKVTHVLDPRLRAIDEASTATTGADDPTSLQDPGASAPPDMRTRLPLLA